MIFHVCGEIHIVDLDGLEDLDDSCVTGSGTIKTTWMNRTIRTQMKDDSDDTIGWVQGSRQISRQGYRLSQMLG